MPDTLALNARLLAACTTDLFHPDYALIDALLSEGAQPLGRVTDEYGDPSCPYTGIVEAFLDHASDKVCPPEPLYKMTELFLRHGMDISKPDASFYIEETGDKLHPLWLFAFESYDLLLPTLRLLLDNGLRAEDAAECWNHIAVDYTFASESFDKTSDDTSKGESIREEVAKIMLIASYPHILDADEDLRSFIWYDYNDKNYDLTRFREWDDFVCTVDTSHCDGEPETARSVVTLVEKASGRAVWTFGFGITPDKL